MEEIEFYLERCVLFKETFKSYTVWHCLIIFLMQLFSRFFLKSLWFWVSSVPWNFIIYVIKFDILHFKAK
jgi:hypothetical protein